MKTMKSMMKTIAMFGLSVCVLAGCALSGFAATPSVEAAVLAHQTDSCQGYERSEIVAQFEKSGQTETYVICAYCGDVSDGSSLRKVSDVVSNFGGIRARTGKLGNGERVMTVAAYSGSGAMNNITADVEMPAGNVEGYDLYLVGADGSQTKIDVSVRHGIAYFSVNMENGAALIRMVEQ